MEFDHVKARRVVEEDRLSSLPDDLIHKILCSFDMKFVVETCLLSSRWKLLWTSMPYLNFSTNEFYTLCKFAKFVTHVLSRRNHRTQVSSVKLVFHGSLSQVFVRKIRNYAFSHNVLGHTIDSWPTSSFADYPPCLFSSQSLKNFTLLPAAYITLKTPLDFPALTTLHLENIGLQSDIFSKCVKLKNLTLEDFGLEDVEVFYIITPRLSNLMLINGYIEVINLIAPQLENLTIINCLIKYLNAPPGLSSLCYMGSRPLQFHNDRFHSLNKVTISMYYPCSRDKKEEARKTINMLQELHSARYLTLNASIIELLSSFPDLLSHHTSPFSNLNCLTLDYNMKMSSEVINFLLENSPSAKVRDRS